MCVRFQDPVTGSEDWISSDQHEKKALSVAHTREFIGVMDALRRFKSRRIRES